MFRRVFATVLVATAITGGVVAQEKAELKVGDPPPDFSLPASDGKTYSSRTSRARRPWSWPGSQGVHAGLHHRVQVACASNGDKIRKYDVAYFMASVDPVEGEKGNKAFAESQRPTSRSSSDPDKKTAEAYGVLDRRGVANRWTFYIGKDGRSPHRQGDQPSDVRGGHAREARRAEGRSKVSRQRQSTVDSRRQSKAVGNRQSGFAVASVGSEQQPPTAYCLLPTAYCRLPTADCRLTSSLQ